MKGSFVQQHKQSKYKLNTIGSACGMNRCITLKLGIKGNKPPSQIHKDEMVMPTHKQQHNTKIKQCFVFLTHARVAAAELWCSC